MNNDEIDVKQIVEGVQLMADVMPEALKAISEMLEEITELLTDIANRVC